MIITHQHAKHAECKTDHVYRFTWNKQPWLSDTYRWGVFLGVSHAPITRVLGLSIL